MSRTSLPTIRDILNLGLEGHARFQGQEGMEITSPINNPDFALIGEWINGVEEELINEATNQDAALQDLQQALHDPHPATPRTLLDALHNYVFPFNVPGTPETTIPAAATTTVIVNQGITVTMQYDHQVVTGSTSYSCTCCTIQ